MKTYNLDTIGDNSLYSASALADLLNHNIKTIRRWVYAGRLHPHFRRNGRNEMFFKGNEVKRDLLAEL